MSRDLWKSFERKVALILGGRRVPVTGRARGDAPDIEHPLYSIEVKHNKKLRVFITNALGQAKAARRPGQVPLVVLGAPGLPVRHSLVVMELGDFGDHFGGGPKVDEESA